MAVAAVADWEVVVGLEVHAQVRTETKMYCSCPVVNTAELGEANRYVCPVCLGHPGTLPRPNRQTVIKALRLATKLSCEVNERSVFARKNYFYPDLPKGYQISQYDLPLAVGGALHYWHLGKHKAARITRVHLEEDTAKLFHLPDGTAALDYNRSGVPLIEIVSEPDFHDAAECVSYLEELRSLLQRLNVSDAAMEAGNFRCEPNVSVRPTGETAYRTKTELKNLNSFATLRRGVEAEAARQVELYVRGQAVKQATLRYDEGRGITVPMRIKETPDDYRYFDDPDIPPLFVSKAMLDEASDGLRASGFEVRQMMVEKDGITHEMAATIAGDTVVHRFYRMCCKDGHEPRIVGNWVTGELVRLMREAPLRIEPDALSAVLAMLKRGEINHAQAKELFAEVFKTGKSPAAVVEERGVHAVAVDDLTEVCRKVIADNAKIVEEIRGGKMNALQVLVGQVMRITHGAANPEKTRQALRELIEQG